jgi:hypothetical protein
MLHVKKGKYVHLFPIVARWPETKKLNSVARVRERTIPTERPPLVGEVSANFCE